MRLITGSIFFSALPIAAVFVAPLIGVKRPAAKPPCSQQTEPPPSHQQAVRLTSGDVENTGGSGPATVFSQVLNVPGAQWLRLQFAEAVLAGDPASDNSSILRLTSIKDGAVQTMKADHVEQWGNTSAYFNGSAVKVEIIAYPGTGINRIAIDEVTAGDIPVEPRTLCGTDDRTLSSDARSGRHLPEGCTAWLHDDLNKTFMAAGHCGVSTNDVVQFNVPLSNANGSLNHPGPQDQYVVEPTSVQFVNGGTGNDWAYFGTLPNANTGLSAFQVQGQHYVKAASAPSVSGQTIRITGYGVVAAPVSPTWQQVQKTHSGPYFSLSGTLIRYQVDTTGGNSGSAVQNLANNTVIGIHTHAGCTATGGSNQGTAIHLASLQTALANPRGICLSGRAPATGPLYASGDLNNNFGTVNTTSGLFGKVSEISVVMQGLAYDRNAAVFYGSNGSSLYRIVPATGAATHVGLISGTAQAMNGLGYDPNTNTLYAISQGSGQLFRINTTTAAATSIGLAWGNTVGALDYDPATNTLYGIDDSAGASKLVRISTSDGSQTVIGALGAGITDCNGLAYNDRDGQLYTINAGNEQLLRINPSTGGASVVGGTSGLFGSGYGMGVTLLATTTVLPGSFSVIVGTHQSGGLAQLLSSNNDYLVVQQIPPRARTFPAIQIEVTSTAPSSTVSTLTFRLEAKTSAIPANGVIQSIQLFNYTSGAWEQVDSRPATASDSVASATITSNPSRFIQAGTLQMRARLNWAGPGIPVSQAWTASVDESIWILGQ